MSRVTQLVKDTAKTQRQLVKIKMHTPWQSVRRKKDVYVPKASRPHQWQRDEEGAHAGKCRFPVKDCGHAEVDESEGTRISEDAVERLKAERQAFQGFFGKTGKKAGKAVLWASAGRLRLWMKKQRPHS